MKKYMIIILIIKTISCAHSQTTVAEWQSKLHIATHDTTKIVCFAKISGLHLRADSIKYYALKGLKISQKYPSHVGNAMLYNNLARAFQIEAKNDSSVYYFKKAHKIALELNDDKQIKYTDFNIITTANSPAEQISRLLGILKKYTYDPINKEYDKILLLGIYRSISQRYLDLDNIEKSKMYLHKSRSYITTYADTLTHYIKSSQVLSASIIKELEVSSSQNTPNLLASYQVLMDQAKDVIAGHEDLFSKQCLVILYGNFASILTKAKRIKESLHYLGLLTEHLDEVPESLTYAKYISLGTNYVEQGNYEAGINYLEKAYTFSKNYGLPVHHIDFLQNLSKAYEKKQDFKKALLYSKEAMYIQKEYLSAKQQQLSLEVERQFELAAKQEEISRIDLEKKLNEERIKVVQQEKSFLFALVITSLLLLLWIFRNYRRQLELKRLLVEQNALLAQNTKELTETNQVKDKIFAVLGHDLQSPMADLTAVMTLFQSRNISSKKIVELMSPLEQKIGEVQLILDNLLKWSIVELKYPCDTSAQTNLDSVLKRVLKQQQKSIEKKSIGIRVDFSDAWVKANNHEIEIILRNLLSNAIKFTPIEGNIRLTVHCDEREVEISIKDTGTGFDFKENELFHPSNPGTAGERGLGIGLRVTQELIKKNKGSLSIISQIGLGTTVQLRFLLAKPETSCSFNKGRLLEQEAKS